MRIDAHQQTFLYKLLMNPDAGYRITRHLLLLLAVVVISFNQAYMGFMGYHELLGHNIYLFTLFILITYLILGYFNIYVLIPRLLLKERYRAYFISFFVSIFFFMTLHFGLEYFVFIYYDLEPTIYSFFSEAGNPLWLEVLSSFLVDSIAIFGVSFTVILKHWLINDNQIHELESAHMQSEVEKLKEKVNPGFLFSILHKVGNLVEEDQEKASDMLMELSEILRYELYDCNREEVLLNSEIGFITNYLRLEQSCTGKMDFRVTTEGDFNGVSIPPFLFLPVIQYVVRKSREGNDPFALDLHFRISPDAISLHCSCPEQARTEDPGLANIQLRLNRLYDKRYLLQIVRDPQPMLSLKIDFLHA